MGTRSVPVTDLAGSAVELRCHGVELDLGHAREIDPAAGEVLAQQAVGVLVRTALPRAARPTEEHRRSAADGALRRRTRFASSRRRQRRWLPSHRESMHGTGAGPSHGERSRLLSCVRRLRFVLASVLLPAGVPRPEHRRRHEQWRRVPQQRAAELVSEQLLRGLHARRSADADSFSPHGRGASGSLP